MCRPETDVARLIATLMVGQHGYGGRHLTDSRHTVVRQADNRFLPTAPPQLIGVVRKRLANALDIAEQPDLDSPPGTNPRAREADYRRRSSRCRCARLPGLQWGLRDGLLNVFAHKRQRQ